MENSQTQFECKISTTNAVVPLAIKILLDGAEIYSNQHVDQDIEFKHNLPEDEAEHELQFVMSGKQPQHTKIDDQGNILEDALLSISDICFDEIDVFKIVTDLGVYSHSFNSSDPVSQHKFYGDLGCNGTLSLRFSTPIYLWLLETL